MHPLAPPFALPLALPLASGVSLTPVDGGGGGGAYTTGAVAFDGATSLLNAALAATDNGLFSASFWVYGPPLGTFSTVMYFNPDGFGSGITLNSNNDPAGIEVFLGEGSDHLYFGQDTAFQNSQWNHYLVSADTTQPTGPQLRKMYKNGVDVTADFDNASNAFTTLFNGLPALIGTDTFGDPLTGYLADVWAAPGQSLLVAGDIPPATLAKFYSGGKPVDLGAAGATPTGVAPDIFLRRAPAAAASTFATNLGTGGDFSITGDLTNAATSPSD